MYSIIRNIYSRIRRFVFDMSDLFETMTFRTKPDESYEEYIFLNKPMER